MTSSAKTVAEYLAQLPPDRRAAIEAVRAVILANLDGDYEEGIQYGMIGYYVPHRVYPPGYHCDPKQPLPFAALASQKAHMAVYLSCVYESEAEAGWFRTAWAATGRKLDMGKSCVRFRRLEDVALEVIGEAVRRTPARAFVARYEATLARPASKPASKAAAAAKKASQPAAPAKKASKPAAPAKKASKPAAAAKKASKAATPAAAAKKVAGSAAKKPRTAPAGKARPNR